MLSYWNETLENISKDPRKDSFKMIVNNIIYEVPLSYAFGISPYITNQYLKDPTFNELNIKINISDNNNNKNKIQEEFCKFIKGGKISSEIFYKIGINLENKEMIKQWSKSEKLMKERVITIIKANRKISHNNNFENIKEELEFIGEHIEEMKEEIKELEDEELIFILKNDKTRVEKEDIIWEVVKEKIDNNLEEGKNNNKRNKC